MGGWICGHCEGKVGTVGRLGRLGGSLVCFGCWCW